MEVLRIEYETGYMELIVGDILSLQTARGKENRSAQSTGIAPIK